MRRSIALAGVLIPGTLAAQGAPCISRRSGSVPAAYAEIVARERTLVCERLATRIPGVQVAVAVNGKVVWSEGFGYADAERKRPDLYYADPLALFDHCKRRYSREVALLHDYGLYEFTMIVRKEG